MRILITSVIDPRKSAHSRLHQFLEYLERNHELTIICPNDSWKSTQTTTEIYALGYHDLFDRINMNYLFEKPFLPIFQETMSYFALWGMLAKLDLQSYDVHFNYNALISGYTVARKLVSYNIKTVFDIADNLPEMIAASPQLPFPFHRVGAMVGRVMMSLNSTIAHGITYTSQFLRDRYSLPREKCLKVPNGVDTELFKPYPSGEMKRHLGLESNFVVGYVGVLREWVDLTPFFEVVLRLCKAGIDAKLLIIGEEGGIGGWATSATRIGIGERAIFTGTVPYHDVPRYIAAMDVCLIPFVPGEISQAACPLKLFEYMACGKPVVSTRLAGVYEEVGDRVLYAEDKRTVYQVLSKLYYDASLREAMAVRGRAFVEEKYSWSNIAPRMERILVKASNKS